MKQISFADAEFAAKKRATRRKRCLGDMERVVPWASLLGVLAPHFYPGSEGRPGRPPIGLERMLRIYVLQQWFGLSDEGLEDTIYDSQALRGFLGIDLVHEAVPDATTLLGFRHLLEAQRLTELIFETVNAGRRARGLILSRGAVTDATTIAAPSSMKNCHIAMKRGRRKAMAEGALEELARRAERLKAQIRAASSIPFMCSRTSSVTAGSATRD